MLVRPGSGSSGPLTTACIWVANNTIAISTDNCFEINAIFLMS